jgi:DNA-binding NtrC family response regulator
VFLKNFTFHSPGQGGFLAPASTSRPPTKAYDKVSRVLVFEESELNLKFLKMHLNRFFSHVTVAKTSSDAIALLKTKDIDVVICDAQPSKKVNSDFLKKLGYSWNYMPVILLDLEKKDIRAESFSQFLVVGVVDDPLSLDSFHIAIRRAFNLRDSLRCLAAALGPKVAMGEIVRMHKVEELNVQQAAWLRDIRFRLIEEILD